MRVVGGGGMGGERGGRGPETRRSTYNGEQECSPPASPTRARIVVVFAAPRKCLNLPWLSAHPTDMSVFLFSSPAEEPLSRQPVRGRDGTGHGTEVGGGTRPSRPRTRAHAHAQAVKGGEDHGTAHGTKLVSCESRQSLTNK